MNTKVEVVGETAAVAAVVVVAAEAISKVKAEEEAAPPSPASRAAIMPQEEAVVTSEVEQAVVGAEETSLWARRWFSSPSPPKAGHHVVHTDIFLSPGSIPQPDSTITKLEDSLLRGNSVDVLSAKMGQVKISGDQDAKANWFPRRPAFGTQGNSVTLWTNYFKLDMSAKVALLKYSLSAERQDRLPKDEKEAKGRKPQAKGKDKKANPGPKGRKLHSIIKSALDQVAKSVPYATEFKDQVISLEPFKLPDNKVVTVQFTDEGKDDVYHVTFNGPITVDLPGLLEYLKTMRDPSGSTSFPKFEDAIDAISIITGFHARRNPAAAALGRSRYFPLNAPADEKYDLNRPEFNRIIRGYFQSARPATGRIILNANVAHGVFRPKGLVSDLVRVFQGDYESLHKVLSSKLRCKCQVLSDEKGKKPRFIQKVICGLAQTRDGTGKGVGPEGPKVKQNGANARNVQFYLRAPAPTGLRSNAYCTVEEYYKKRKRAKLHMKYNADSFQDTDTPSIPSSPWSTLEPR